MIGRRAFVAAVAGALIVPAALGQGKRMKVVGYLSGGGGPPDELARAMAQEGLAAGRDFRFEVRAPPNWEPATLARAAAELVEMKPDVLLAWMGNRVGALATASRTIPIVCGGMPDPVGSGLAASLRRPGGNVTGISWGFPEIAAISLGLLKQLRPALSRLGFVHPPGTALEQLRGHQVAAKNLGIEWRPILVGPDDDLDRLLAPLEGQAMMIAPSRNLDFADRVRPVGQRKRIVMFGVPKEAALMAYSLDFENATQRIAAILSKVLRGANPAEIPFELPDRPSFTLNRRVARELGLSIPPDVLLRATEVLD